MSNENTIPEFLQKPNLTKPEVSERERNREKINELIAGMDVDEATDICHFISIKYPRIMLNAVSERMGELIKVNNSIKETVNSLEEV